jgi:hypothetical protein
MRQREEAVPKPYEDPVLRKLTFSQATLFLTGYAYIGEKGARELLELLFPEPVCQSESEEMKEIQNRAEPPRDVKKVKAPEPRTAA